MKSIYSSIVILFWIPIHGAICQDISEKYICWEEGVTLMWSDFQGMPDTTSLGKAGCASELLAQGFWDQGLPNFLISNCFDRSVSWTVDTTSDQLLAHEKLHFDIAEIHARMMRKGIDSLRKEGIKDFAPYSKVVQNLLERRNKIDSLYDEETAHSIYESEQLRWEMKVREKLESLRAYSTECYRD